MSAISKKKRKKNKSQLTNEQPRSLSFAEKGIRTGGDFAGMMSALMSDTISGRISPQVTNATVNAGGKLLKVVELQLKYGTPNAEGKRSELMLTPTPPVIEASGSVVS